jgi:glutathione S-transferase
MLTLFYAPGACSLVPHIALEEAGADYQGQRVNFAAGDQRKSEFLRVNPKGRVPALVTDRGVLTETPAILGYIARCFPEAALADWADPFAFADMQAFQIYIATTLHIVFRQISRAETFADGAAAAAALKAKVPEKSNEYFALIEAKLADGRSWVHGQHYTLSDPYLFVFSSYLRLGDRGDFSRFPQVRAHQDRVRQRPAVQRALAAEGLVGHKGESVNETPGVIRSIWT